jgi:hypothetical protein
MFKNASPIATNMVPAVRPIAPSQPPLPVGVNPAANSRGIPMPLGSVPQDNSLPTGINPASNLSRNSMPTRPLRPGRGGLYGVRNV